MRIKWTDQKYNGKRRIRLATPVSELRSQALRDNLCTTESLEVIIRTSEGKQEKVADKLEKIGKVKHVYKSIPYVAMRAEANDIKQINNAITGGSAIKSFLSSFNPMISLIKGIDISSVVSVPYLEKSFTKVGQVNERLWNLEQIGVYDAWGYSTAEGVKMGIVDTGVDYTHPQLKDRFGWEKGYDFVTNSPDPMDYNGHGTHVAGTASGDKTGIAIDSRLYALGALNAQGVGSEADAIACVDWCIQKKVDVINMSMGSPIASQAFEDICRHAASQDIVIVAAAGNNEVGPSYPAAFDDYVIAVAATTQDKKHASFSNVYHTNDISAPGVDIVSSVPGGYASYTGTSMSSPMAGGTLSLAVKLLATKDMYPLMTSTAEILEQDPEWDYNDAFGAGLIRADRMMMKINEFPDRKYERREPLVASVKRVLWD